jgi:N-acetylglutamate synthase-like GNAT family acetyltransferase
MKIRPARLEDSPVIAGLGTQLGYPMSPEQAETRLRDLLGREEHEVLVAEEDGSVIGWAHVAGMRQVVNDPFAELLALVVDESVRSRSTDAALVEAVEAWSARNGFGTLRVRSNVIRERTHRFYDRLGFERTKSQVVFARPVRVDSETPR